MRVRGDSARSTRATPFSVPPDPKPSRNSRASRPECGEDLLAVVARMDVGVGFVVNCRHRYQPCACASSIALRSMPEPFSARA
jgi:hypothetical protein